MITALLRAAGSLALLLLLLIVVSASGQAQGHSTEGIKGDKILMTRNGQQFFSHDGGISWEKVAPVSSASTTVPMPRILLQKHTGEQFLSTDGGMTWERVQSQDENDISTPLPSIGEAVWEKNIPVDSSSSVVPNGVIILSDGSILINGGNMGIGYMMKVDASGQRQWVRSYGHKDSLIYVFTGIERTPDTLQFIGVKRISIITPSAYTYMITADPNGNIYSAGAPEPLYENGTATLAPLGTSGFIEAGSIMSGVSEVLGNMFLRKTGVAPTWEKSYAREKDLQLTPIKALPTADGGFAILVSHMDSARIIYPGIIRTDAEGEVIWRKRYDTAMAPTGLVETAGGGFTFTGNFTQTGASTWTAAVVHVDNEGEISWHKNYGIGPITSSSALIGSPDGGYLIGGYTARFNNAGTRVDDTTRNYYLLKVDSQGEKIKDQTWGEGGIAEAITQLVRKGNHYIVAGYSNAPSRTLYLAELEDMVAAVPSLDPQDSRYNLVLYPNPATLSAEVRFTLDAHNNVELTLLDKLGKEVRTWHKGLMEAGEHEVRLDVQDIANGLYILQAVIGEHVTSQKLLIIR